MKHTHTQNVWKEETNALQNFLTFKTPVHTTAQFNPFKHQDSVDYTVCSTSNCSTKASTKDESTKS
jgi:hypothetical protein